MAEKIETIYASCDRAIKALDREMVEDFGRLKLIKWDELNIVRKVTELYRKSAQKARKRYYEVAFEAYVLILLWNGTDTQKAHKMAEKAITEKWVDAILEEPDVLTLYAFNAETERKAQKLAETLSVTQNRDREIDLAMRAWSKHVGQYAINFTDYAAMQAYEDAGIDEVEWVTQKDERVCSKCGALDGKIFRLDEVPLKPHWGCRCTVRRARKERDTK